MMCIESSNSYNSKDLRFFCVFQNSRRINPQNRKSVLEKNKIGTLSRSMLYELQARKNKIYHNSKRVGEIKKLILLS